MMVANLHRRRAGQLCWSTEVREVKFEFFATRCTHILITAREGAEQARCAIIMAPCDMHAFPIHFSKDAASREKS